MSVKYICALVGIAIGLCGLLPVKGEEAADGANLFARRCGGCHSLDADKEGPQLRSVYGRKAGTVPSFTYSEALKKSDVTWDAASLDKWLTEPGDFVRDADMDFRVPSADERSAIIGYLKHLGGK
jgi:cytochrome c